MLPLGAEPSSNRHQWRLLVSALLVLDAAGVATAMVVATVILATVSPHLNAVPRHPGMVALVIPFALFSFLGQGLYDPHNLLVGMREFVGVVKASAIGLIAFLVVSFLLVEPPPRGWTILAWLLAVVIVAGVRLGARRVAQRLRRRSLLVQRALLVGANSHSINIARQLSGSASGIDIVGILDDYLPVGSTLDGGLRVLGSSSELAAVAARTGAREAIVVPQALPWETLEEVLTEAASRPEGIRVELSAGYYDLLTAGGGVYQLNHVPLLPVSRIGLSRGEEISKRALDYSLASLLLLSLSPVLLVAVLRARAGRPGTPALQRQEAVGRWGRPFRLLSLAPEVSPFTVVRKLPGLVNVLRGELSVVGPRPVAPGSGANGHLPATASIRPGLTGLWREADDATEQALLDLYYVRSYSLWMDLYILFIRLRARLWRRKPGRAAKEAREWLGTNAHQFTGPGLDGRHVAAQASEAGVGESVPS